MLNKAISKYLARYAEPESRQLGSFPNHYRYCLCIPAFDEPTEFINGLLSFLTRQSQTLVIVVLNQPDQLTTPTKKNLDCAAILIENTRALWHSATLSLFRVGDDDNINKHSGNDILLVDRFHKGLKIPEQQGVGLARKIAADIALTLISQQIIKQPWIFSSDADVALPDDYFDAIQTINIEHRQHATPKIAACLFPYAHRASGNVDIDDATALYEKRLHYYVDGLASAGSPYAFHTLGSTIVIYAAHYAMVRGFPKRSAGEDFYILNKLRKTGDIHQLNAPTLAIASRSSHRTVFGTGAAVGDLLALDSPESAKLFYHPKIFHRLKQTLDWLSDYGNSDYARRRLARVEPTGSAADESLDQNWPSHLLGNQFIIADAGLIVSALQAIGFNKGLEHSLQQARDLHQYQRHISDWFDAFKTLKWIHYLRDNSQDYHSLTLAQYHAEAHRSHAAD